MRVEKHKAVAIDYTLRDDAGEIVDSNADGDPLWYLHGVGSLIPGLESALDGRSKGDTFQSEVVPLEAYGERDDSLVQTFPREQFAGIEDLTLGAELIVEDDDGSEMMVVVVNMDDEQVTIDGNHELAGETLFFEVKVADVRDATAEEISHGHLHTAEGCESHME